jgi:hypothetical protein
MSSMSVKIPEPPTDDDWVRLPKAKGRLHGLARTTWIELINSGHVKSVTIRKGNAERGIRLISMASYRQYLLTLQAEQQAANATQ